MLIRARQGDPPELVGARPMSRRFIKTYEADLRLIEGLVSSPLVFIRVKNGGKAGGFLTTGNAVLVRSSSQQVGQAEWSRCVYQSELETLGCCIYVCIIRSPGSWQFTVVCGVFECLRRLQSLELSI